jgi:hypothetical protein
MFVTGLANLAVLGPATTKIMKERKHQGMLAIDERGCVRDSGNIANLVNRRNQRW